MNKEELEKYIEKDFLPGLLSSLPNVPDLTGENARLKAEVERLRKAGDAMAGSISLNDDVFDNQEKKEAQAAWTAAKEGKQP